MLEYQNCLNSKRSSGFVWRLPNSIIGPQVAGQRITYTIPQTKTEKLKYRQFVTNITI